MNKYTAAGLDVARRAKKLRKKYHPELDKARVRVDFLFVATVNAEDGCPLKCNGYPALAVASLVPQANRVGLKADARIIIDKEAWDELSDRQKDAVVDHELYHFQAVINDGLVATDGNDRPKIRMRKHDVQLGFFSAIAQRHGEHSQEVIQSKALIEHAATVFLPGFEFTAKSLPGQKKAGKSNVVAMPPQASAEQKVAAK